MSKIKLGILGGGGDSLIGVLHRVASQMHDRYEIVGGVFNPNYNENIKFAEQIGVNRDRVYNDFDTLVAEEIQKPKEERIEVISILTPNFLHFPMAKKLIENDSQLKLAENKEIREEYSKLNKNSILWKHIS